MRQQHRVCGVCDMICSWVYTENMEITWYGTATIRLRMQRLDLLFDPFVPLPGAPEALPANHLLPAPHVLITHGHLDHLCSVPELVRQGAEQIFATATPCATLTKKGVPPQVLNCIKPGDQLYFSTNQTSTSADTADVTVSVLAGRHIRFDARLVLTTLFSPRTLRYAGNARTLLKDNQLYAENGETVIFEVTHNSTLVTVLGSLSLAEDERYTTGPDLLVLPYQGHSHLAPIALSIIERLRPRAVLLDHFDNTFPPISRSVDTAPLAQALAQEHPEIRLIIPQPETTYRIDENSPLI